MKSISIDVNAVCSSESQIYGMTHRKLILFVAFFKHFLVDNMTEVLQSNAIYAIIIYKF